MSTGDHPKRGDIIAGKFQVEDVLGAGGMGVVVAARHLVLRQRVAVKFLLPQAARLPEASARFVREAQAAVALQTEHVARVLDVGVLEDGAPFMVMEFLAGTDFSRFLKQNGPLPVADAVDYLLQAGEAIAEAHALGIVHRDLKPGNLFLTTRAGGSQTVKVLDFGLSKVLAQEGAAPEASLTATGFVAGSPYYMAPEQIRSLKHVDRRVDVWAMGVILYEMLTGRRPFDGPSLTAVCASISADTPAPMRALRAEIPEALDAAVLACLERSLDRRTGSVAELAQALAPFAPQRSLPSVEQILRLVPGTATAPVPAVDADAVATLELPVLAPLAPAAGEPPVGLAPQVDEPAAPEAPTTGAASAWGQTKPFAKRLPVALLAGGALAALALMLGTTGWLLHGPRRQEAAAMTSVMPPHAGSSAIPAAATVQEAPTTTVSATTPAPLSDAPSATAWASASASSPPAPVKVPQSMPRSDKTPPKPTAAINDDILNQPR
jgi:serine/threonine-protein kinase